MFTTSAISHPEIGFSLNIDGREVYRCPPGSTLEERIGSLFGRDFADEVDGLRRIGARQPDGRAALDGVGVSIGLA